MCENVVIDIREVSFVITIYRFVHQNKRVNMESVQFSKNRLNPDMGHGGLFKFMGAS